MISSYRDAIVLLMVPTHASPCERRCYSHAIFTPSIQKVCRLRNPDGGTKNLACRDMRQFEFFTLSRMSLKLYTYEV